MNPLTPQPPGGGLPVKVPMKMPVKVPMLSAALQPHPPNPPQPMVATNRPSEKRPRMEPAKPSRGAAFAADSPSSSSSSSSSSASSQSDASRSRGSSEANSSSNELSSSSSSSSVATPSSTISEPTLFQLAENEGLLTEEALLQDEEETTEPIIPPRPPVIRSFPSDLDKAIERYKERLNREQNVIAIKDDNKAVSLGTSKVNYIDPRIICSWASEQSVPINKIFSATLQKKFPWALDAQGFNF